MSGDDNDGKFWNPALQLLHQRNAVYREHHEVDKGNVISRLAQKVLIDLHQAIFRSLKTSDIVAGRAQADRHRLQDMRLVINEENAAIRHTGLLPINEIVSLEGTVWTSPIA